MSNHERLHLRIKELREEAGLSQAEMAKKMGISQQTYSRYENHTSEIPLAKFAWLAEYFDVSTDYILGRDVER